LNVADKLNVGLRERSVFGLQEVELFILGYIDGGSGSIALQIILAGALSAVYAFHTGWAKIKKKLFKRSDAKQETASK
jgi:hypothetical protein